MNAFLVVLNGVLLFPTDTSILKWHISCQLVGVAKGPSAVINNMILIGSISF